MSFRPQVECLEERCCPIVHSFSAGALASASPNAGGSPQATAAILFRSALGATPVPIVASDGAIPFDSVPGRDVLILHGSNAVL